MSETKYLTSAGGLKAAAPPGHLEAIFSTFGGPPDRDGDIVLASAFTPGQAVPLVWAHDWDRPIGVGAIRVEPERAIFDGRLFLETTDGHDAYERIKGLGALQQYSWGFRVRDQEPGTWQGAPVRVIKAAEVFEVSPVLVGANRFTGTLALKRGARISRATRAQVEAALELLSALIADPSYAEPDAPDEDGPGAAPEAPPPLADRVTTLGAELRAVRALALAAPLVELRAAAEPLASLGYLLGDVQAQLQARRRVALHGDAPDTAALYREFTALSASLAPLVGEE